MKSMSKYIKKSEKLSRKLEECRQRAREHWNYKLAKEDYIDLTVAMRIMAADKRIWCLIRWRHKMDKTKQAKGYCDEYFWCLQAIYLQKLNCNKDEVYLPDFYEHQLENEANKKLKRKDEDIKALKIKAEEFRQKQIKRQKETNERMKQLKIRLSTVSDIDKDAQIKSMRAQFELKKQAVKEKYVQKLEECRQRAREMLEEKEKQLMLLQNAKNTTPPSSNTNDIKIINTFNNYQRNEYIQYDKQTQTSHADAESEHEQSETMEGMMTEGDEKKENEYADNPNSITIIYHQKQKIKIFGKRLKKLAELLAESEEQHKRKNMQMEELKVAKFATKNEESSSWNHSEYLKNALLQYFDGKIDLNNLISVVSVGLNLDEEEREKARQGKLMTEQTAKSWWG